MAKDTKPKAIGYLSMPQPDVFVAIQPELCPSIAPFRSSPTEIALPMIKFPNVPGNAARLPSNA